MNEIDKLIIRLSLQIGQLELALHQAKQEVTKLQELLKDK